MKPAATSRRASLTDRFRRARLALLRRRVPGLGRIETEVPITVAGQRIMIPVVAGIGFQHRVTPELQLVDAIRTAFSLREGAFIDVGAHLGETLIKLLAVDSRREYLGFEPQVPAAAYVRRMLQANEASGAVICAALSDHNGAMTLMLDAELGGGATVVESFRTPDQYQERSPVPVLRGDDAVRAAGLESVAVLKIDAEGAELDVLEGFAEVIERDRPIIFCEMLPPGMSPEVGAFREERIRAVRQLATQSGYRVLGIDPKGAIADPDMMLGASLFDLRDYAFVPEDALERFLDGVELSTEMPFDRGA